MAIVPESEWSTPIFTVSCAHAPTAADAVNTITHAHSMPNRHFMYPAPSNFPAQ
jgi:hypothetical protein